MQFAIQNKNCSFLFHGDIKAFKVYILVCPWQQAAMRYLEYVLSTFQTAAIHTKR